MLNLSNNTKSFIRYMASIKSTRPLESLLFTNIEYPNNNFSYSLILTASTIGISQGNQSFSITYVGKSTKQVALELSNSPFPIEVKAIADIGLLESGELIASGAVIPNSFSIEDTSADGKSAIIRCKRWAGSYNKLAAITLKAPYFERANLPWYPRITNGNFSTVYNSITYHFGVPEYKYQTWSALYGAPFADVEAEPARFIKKNIIKTSKSPILFKNNNIVITNDNQTKIFSSSVVKDVDIFNGFIYIKEDIILPNDTILYYSYLEQNYIYKHININGHFNQNPFILDKYVVLYLLPIKSSSGIERSRGIYHSVGASIEDAIYSITVENTAEPIAIIGAINVRQFINKEDINIVDTRSYGGGLREDSFGNSIENKFKESQYFLDITSTDGIRYPGSAAIVIDLPPEIKEVMSLSEIQKRASKFIGAGIYTIFNYAEQDYYKKFAVTEYNSDISLIKYDFEFANPIYTGIETVATLANSGSFLIGITGDLDQRYIYGSNEDVAYWVNQKLSLPDNLYTGYSALSLEPQPIYNSSNDKIILEPGNSYYIGYIRSSPYPVFSYEEKTESSDWQRKTIVDTRTVPYNQLAAGYLGIDATYSRKEVRNFTGIAPYQTANIYDKLWEDLVGDIVDIVEGARPAIASGVVIKTNNNVLDTTLTPKEIPVHPGFDPLIEPLLVDYDTMIAKSVYSGESIPKETVNLFYRAVQSFNSPRFADSWDYENNVFFNNAFDGRYNAIRDIYISSRYTTHRMNQYSLTVGSNKPSILITGAAWLPTNHDTYASYAFSGMLQTIRQVNEISPYSGITTAINSHIIPPDYNCSLRDVYPLVLSNNYSEINPLLNEVHRGTEYIRAFAAAYATQLAPTIPEAESLSVKTDMDFIPRDIALSGIIMFTDNFDSYFYSPTKDGLAITLSGELLNDTWLTRYNRISSFGGNYLDDCCAAYDYIYYGNKEWAGYSGYEQKSGPYYHAVSNNFAIYQSDHRLMTGIIDWPFSISRPGEESLAVIVSGIYNNMMKMKPYIDTASKRGGIMQPGYINAVSNYLWLPIHNKLEDPLFTEETNVYLSGVVSLSGLIDTFEIGMAAIIKGSLLEDNIISEGGSFKYKPAPYSGAVPSKLFEACANAIQYYTLAEDTSNKERWLCIAEGLYRTVTGNYKLRGGYPFNPNYTESNALGDAGSAPLKGFLKLLKQMPDGLTFYTPTVL